jgi:hypothetical protein
VSLYSDSAQAFPYTRPSTYTSGGTGNLILGEGSRLLRTRRAALVTCSTAKLFAAAVDRVARPYNRGSPIKKRGAGEAGLKVAELLDRRLRRSGGERRAGHRSHNILSGPAAGRASLAACLALLGPLYNRGGAGPSRGGVKELAKLRSAYYSARHPPRGGAWTRSFARGQASASPCSARVHSDRFCLPRVAPIIRTKRTSC